MEREQKLISDQIHYQLMSPNFMQSFCLSSEPKIFFSLFLIFGWEFSSLGEQVQLCLKAKVEVAQAEPGAFCCVYPPALSSSFLSALLVRSVAC